MTNLATRHIAPAKKQLPKNKKGEISIVIPAAGMGYRMKSYGPKALIPLYGGVTIIERQIQILSECYPNAEFVIVIGFEADKIREKLKDYPVHFIFNPIHESTNVLFSLGLAMQAIISESVLIVYGDLIFNHNAVRNLRANNSKIIADAYHNMRKDEVGVTIQGKIAMNFAYGLENIWGQIACLTGKELELFKEISVRSDTSQWFGYEGLNYVIEEGGQLEVIRPRTMSLTEIDFTKDLEKIAI